MPGEAGKGFVKHLSHALQEWAGYHPLGKEGRACQTKGMGVTREDLLVMGMEKWELGWEGS